MVRESRRVHFASQWPPSEPTGFYLDGAGGRLLPRPLSRLATPSRPQGGANSTSQGQPRTLFRRAPERGNLVLAEVAAREVGRVTIAEALELTALVARSSPTAPAASPPAGSASGSRNTSRRRSTTSRCSSLSCARSRLRRTRVGAGDPEESRTAGWPRRRTANPAAEAASRQGERIWRPLL